MERVILPRYDEQISSQARAVSRGVTRTEIEDWERGDEKMMRESISVAVFLLAYLGNLRKEISATSSTQLNPRASEKNDR